jgi:hypothetical protein
MRTKIHYKLTAPYAGKYTARSEGAKGIEVPFRNDVLENITMDEALPDIQLDVLDTIAGNVSMEHEPTTDTNGRVMYVRDVLVFDFYIDLSCKCVNATKEMIRDEALKGLMFWLDGYEGRPTFEFLEFYYTEEV